MVQSLSRNWSGAILPTLKARVRVSKDSSSCNAVAASCCSNVSIACRFSSNSNGNGSGYGSGYGSGTGSGTGSWSATGSNPFRGTIYGNGKLIKNVKLIPYSINLGSDYYAASLFGFTEGAEFKEFGLLNVSVDTSSGNNAYYGAALVYSAKSTKFDDIFIKGNFGSVTGNFASFANILDSGSYIKNCYSANSMVTSDEYSKPELFPSKAIRRI